MVLLYADWEDRPLAYDLAPMLLRVHYPVFPTLASPRTITGGPGKDRIKSYGTANDTIYAQDDTEDTITSCGEGTDTVYFDKGTDKVNPVNCENRIAQPAPE